MITIPKRQTLPNASKRPSSPPYVFLSLLMTQLSPFLRFLQKQKESQLIVRSCCACRPGSIRNKGAERNSGLSLLRVCFPMRSGPGVALCDVARFCMSHINQVPSCVDDDITQLQHRPTGSGICKAQNFEKKPIFGRMSDQRGEVGAEGRSNIATMHPPCTINKGIYL